MHIDRAYLHDTLSALVRCNSINPAFGTGGTDESEAADLVASWLREMGAETRTCEFAPGRRSVIGRLPGVGGGRSLMLYGHLDTVGVEGMTAPFDPEVLDGRMYGRGTYDMKGGVAACLAAARAVVESGTPHRGDLYVVGVADEETESRGMQQVLELIRPDAAIVTEATELDIGVAHKGFCWIEVVTEGRAAHGSRPDEGVDANQMMGRFLAAFEAHAEAIRRGPSHPLVGSGSAHVGTIHGGTGPSIYAATCRVELERRTLPGERPSEVLAAIQGMLDQLAGRDPAFRATCRLLLDRPSFEQDPASPIVAAVQAATVAVRGEPARVIGHSFWMDASLLKEAGVETVVLGPSGAGAHADVEFVDLGSVRTLAAILGTAAVDWLL